MTTSTLPRYGRRASSNRSSQDPLRSSKSTDEFDALLELPSLPRAAKSEQNLLNRSVRGRRPGRRRSDFPASRPEDDGGRLRVPRGSVGAMMEEVTLLADTPKPN